MSQLNDDQGIGPFMDLSKWKGFSSALVGVVRFIMIDEKLLAFLSCPACQGDVELKDNKIVCTQCQRKYPITDGIPVLLVDSAQN